ncbi:MAG TPA: TlpA disulfide reductase family protein [Bryobacteraceae bacterium]|jgi:thiol-disulfide isomerase/thioredoxin|nr:TlpA disulfide reductase family protein [Bryobacteraceae bacterium]
MANVIPRLAFAAALAGAAVLAQDCQIPPETGSLTLPQVRAQLDAGREEFFLYQRLLDLTPTRPKPGILAPEFQKKIEQHPDDARFLYLYGRSLIGKDTAQGIVYLNRAADAAPKFSWVYTALASIYSSRNFLDEPKLLANLRLYRGLCPANTDGFRYFSKVKDPVVTAEWPVELRPLLEVSHDPRDADLWRMLWAAEFRLTPKEDYPVLRQRVAADVKRLESLALSHDYKFLLALFDGYNLSGQTDSAAKIVEIESDQEFQQAYKAWEDANDIVRRNVGQEAHRIIMQDLAKQSAEWVVKWPTSVNAWDTRLNALSHTPGWTKQEMERVGDQVLKLDAEQEMGWTYIPRKLSVAQTWARNGVRLKDAVKLAEEALQEILLGPEVMSDLTAPPNAAEIAAHRMFGFDSSIWDAMIAVVDGSAQLKDFDKAESMHWRMRQWLEDNQSKKDDPTSGYTLFQARYFKSAGDIAEAKGHKLDAAGFYAKSASVSYLYPEVVEHGLGLWEEAGGSKEVWEALAARPAPPKPAAIQAALEYRAWQGVALPLPEMNLHDLLGKSWTLTSLKGKRTFVNVWATYCTPCVEELPHLQKLYELSVNHGGIQIITLNVDENPGEIEPFMKSRKYTFPVITGARKYVEDITGHFFSIPMNWLVNQSAVIEQKSLGFESKPADWPKQMLEKLAELL